MGDKYLTIPEYVLEERVAEGGIATGEADVRNALLFITNPWVKSGDNSAAHQAYDDLYVQEEEDDIYDQIKDLESNYYRKGYAKGLKRNRGRSHNQYGRGTNRLLRN